MNPRFDKMMDGAFAYALSDKSDPFALARAIAHTRNGFASIDGDKERCYGAERTSETRQLPGGETYSITVYKNAVRP